MKILDCFDFDGTLWRNPMNTPETLAAYEKATGIPWIISKSKSKELSRRFGRFIGPRQGWYGRVETLQPPLVPDPTPDEWFIKETVVKFSQSRQDPERATIIMTGRHAGLAQAVYRIIHDGKLAEVEKLSNGTFKWIDPNVQIYLLGNSGPAFHLSDKIKPQETFAWKRWILKQFVDLLVDLEEINIWEDRPEHIEAFNALNVDFNPITIKVHPVVS